MKAAKKNKTAPALGEFNAREVLKFLQEFSDQLKSGEVRNLRTRTITLPERLPSRSAKEVRAVREKLRVSQSVFAALLNVPRRTVQSWENNQRKPSGAALKLLDMAVQHPELFAVVSDGLNPAQAPAKVNPGLSRVPGLWPTANSLAPAIQSDVKGPGQAKHGGVKVSAQREAGVPEVVVVNPAAVRTAASLAKGKRRPSVAGMAGKS